MTTPLENPAAFLSDEDALTFLQNEFFNKSRGIDPKKCREKLDETFAEEQYYDFETLAASIYSLLIAGREQEAINTLKEIEVWSGSAEVRKGTGEKIDRETIWYSLIMDVTPYAAAAEAWDCFEVLIGNSLADRRTRCKGCTMAGKVCLVNGWKDKSLELFEKAKAFALGDPYVWVGGIDELINKAKAKQNIQN